MSLREHSQHVFLVEYTPGIGMFLYYRPRLVNVGCLDVFRTHCEPQEVLLMDTGRGHVELVRGIDRLQQEFVQIIVALDWKYIMKKK